MARRTVYLVCAALHAAVGCQRSESGSPDLAVDDGGGAAVCDPGRAACFGECVDTSTNPFHCGGCDGVCVAAQACVAGKCACPPGRSLCGFECVDLRGESAHCGQCDHSCGDHLCVEGACAACTHTLLLPALPMVGTGPGRRATPRLVTADFDQDGLPDMAPLFLPGGGVPVPSAAVGLVFHSARRRFAPPRMFSGVYFGVTDVAAGDVDGDGRSNLVILDDLGRVAVITDFSSDFSLWNQRLLQSVRTMAVADLDGDGHADLATASGQGEVTLSLQFRPNQFGETRQLMLGKAIGRLLAADLDADGKPDLIALDVADNTLKVARNLGGSFAPAASYPMKGPVSGLTPADLDGDKRPELLIVDYMENAVVVFPNRGDGTLAAPVRIPLGAAPGAFTTGDLDGNGTTDVALVLSQDAAHMRSQDLVVILPGDGKGGFTTAVPVAGPGRPEMLAIADYDGDGRNDLAIADYSGEVDVLWNEGGWPQASFRGTPAHGRPTVLRAADLDGDRHLDLVQASTDARVTLHFGRGDGTFDLGPSYETVGPIADLAVGDLDGDGRMDVAATTLQGDSVRLLFNRGGRVLGDARDLPSTAGAGALAIGDLDADGRADLVAGSTKEQSVAVYLGAGGGPGAARRVATTVAAQALAIVDLDGDRLPELAVSCYWKMTLPSRRRLRGSEATDDACSSMSQSATVNSLSATPWMLKLPLPGASFDSIARGTVPPPASPGPGKVQTTDVDCAPDEVV